MLEHARRTDTQVAVLFIAWTASHRQRHAPVMRPVLAEVAQRMLKPERPGAYRPARW